MLSSLVLFSLILLDAHVAPAAGAAVAFDSACTQGSEALKAAPVAAPPVTPWPLLKNQPYGPFKVSFGGDSRLRYESRQDYYNDTGIQNDDGLWFLRTRINIGVAAGDHLSFFIEGLDAREWESDPSPNPQEDNLDLHQAFVKVAKPADLPLSLTVGRQKLEYGAKRLIAAPQWSNRIRSFDAVRLSYTPSWFGDIDFFFANQVIYDDNNLNNPRWGENFFGVYSTYKKIPNQVFDLYWLALYDNRHEVSGEIGGQQPEDLERYTVGTRGEGKIPGIANLGYGYEVAYQYGDNGPDDISAYGWHADLNYTFSTLRYKPKVTLDCNVASGDDDPTDGDAETFNPLFQTTHDPYGIIDFFRWQNVNHYGLICDLALHPKVKTSIQYHRFYLDEKEDAWYNSSGRKIRQDKNGNSDDYVGDELDWFVRYQVLSYLCFETGYAHFFAGDFVEDTDDLTGKGDSDSDWFYAQAVFTF